jgi:hypothetical protein
MVHVSPTHEFWSIGVIDHGMEDDDLPELLDDDQTEIRTSAQEPVGKSELVENSVDPPVREPTRLELALARYERAVVLPSLKATIFQFLDENAREELSESISDWLDTLGDDKKFLPNLRHEKKIVIQWNGRQAYHEYLKPARFLLGGLVNLWATEYLPLELDLEVCSNDGIQFGCAVSPTWIASVRAFSDVEAELIHAASAAMDKVGPEDREVSFALSPLPGRLSSAIQDQIVRGFDADIKTVKAPLNSATCARLVFRTLIRPFWHRHGALLVRIDVPSVQESEIQVKAFFSREPGLFRDIDVVETPACWNDD